MFENQKLSGNNMVTIILYKALAQLVLQFGMPREFQLYLQFYSDDVSTFMSVDQENFNESPFVFSNNSPNLFVDRNGKIPIRIFNSVSKVEARELYGYVQKLTDDHVTLAKKSEQAHYELLLDRTENVQSLPAGTQLLRNLEDASGRYGVTIDIHNSNNFSKAAGKPKSYSNIKGHMHSEDLCDYQFQGETYKMRWVQNDAVANITNAIPRTNPVSKVLTADGIIKEWDFRYASPLEIILAHELIHANNIIRGRYFLWNEERNYFRSLNNISTVQHRAPIPGNSFHESVSLEELRTVGLRSESPSHNLLDGIDRSGISENSIRHEQGLPYRISYMQIP